MVISEMKNKIQEMDLEIAEKVGLLAEDLRSMKITKEDADKQIEELRAKKNELEKQLAQVNAPKEKEERSVKLTNADFIKAATEKRSITIGGNGMINQVRTLVQAIGDKDGVLNDVSFWYGPNASTAIPVLDPTLADPEGYAEGAANIASDTTAIYGTCLIQPKCHSAVLPVSLEALTLGTVNLEAELPAVFEKAFRKVMHKKLLIGADSGNGFTGIFGAVPDANKTACAGSAPTITELAKFAIALAGKDEVYDIVMSPTVYSAILSDSTAGENIKVYKEMLIRDKTIEGIKVRVENFAPNSSTAGATLCVGVPLSRYGIGVGGEIIIDAIKVKGDSNTYFQASMFLGGKQYSPNDLYGLKAA